MKNLKLLIVEDSKNDVTLLLRQLSNDGYDIQSLVVQTSKDLKDALAGQVWDIILSDYAMPRFSGLDALEVLKTSGLDIPFIIISGVIGEDKAVEAMRIGVHDYLMKNNLKRLAPAIEREIRNAEIRKARRQADEALAVSETIQRQLGETLFLVLNALPAHICLLDNDGNILEVNNEWKEFAFENGYAGINHGVGSNFLENFKNTTGVSAGNAELVADNCRDVLSGESPYFEMEYSSHSPTEKRWFILTVTPLHKEKSAGAVVMHLNITERKLKEEQLQHDAFHDDLTGLANRTLFIDHLQMTIERAKRDPNELFAVLFLDFDRFKIINDSLGHAAGDELLKQIARRLESTLRSGDLIARLGGDEFTILANKLIDPSVASLIAEHIRKNLEIPFKIGGSEIFITASIGIALSQTGYEKAEEMLHDADIAMYRAKAEGKS